MIYDPRYLEVLNEAWTSNPASEATRHRDQKSLTLDEWQKAQERLRPPILSTSIPTVKVRGPNGEPMFINESDFDSAVHELWREKEAELRWNETTLVSTGPVPEDASEAILGAQGPVLRDVPASPLAPGPGEPPPASAVSSTAAGTRRPAMAGGAPPLVTPWSDELEDEPQHRGSRFRPARELRDKDRCVAVGVHTGRRCGRRATHGTVCHDHLVELARSSRSGRRRNLEKNLAALLVQLADTRVAIADIDALTQPWWRRLIAWTRTKFTG